MGDRRNDAHHPWGVPLLYITVRCGIQGPTLVKGKQTGKMSALVLIIPEELGGVSHPRNMVMLFQPMADKFKDWTPAMQLVAMKRILPDAEFDGAHGFCKAVRDAKKSGLDTDAAIAAVVDADPAV